MKDYKNKCVNCGCKVDNRTKRCKSCYDKWREETKENRALKFKEYQKKWYSENKENIILKSTKRHKSLSFEKRKDYTLKSKYKISIDDYNNLLEMSNFQCNICDKIHSNEEPLAVDHCHNTKKVRGLLCRSCNTALGHFKDDTQNLINAIKYLKNE